MSTTLSKPDTTVLFMARREELRLTKRKRYPQRNPQTGEFLGYTPGEYVAFRSGVYRVPREGEIVLRDSLDGGHATVDAAEVLEWLERHPLNGDLFEGFWKVDPTAPPVQDTEMDLLMELQANYDRAGLEQLLADEEAGWKREIVLNAARKGIERIVAAEQAAEQAAKPAKPAKG